MAFLLGSLTSGLFSGMKSMQDFINTRDEMRHRKLLYQSQEDAAAKVKQGIETGGGDVGKTDANGNLQMPKVAGVDTTPSYTSAAVTPVTSEPLPAAPTKPAPTTPSSIFRPPPVTPPQFNTDSDPEVMKWARQSPRVSGASPAPPAGSTQAPQYLPTADLNRPDLPDWARQSARATDIRMAPGQGALQLPDVNVTAPAPGAPVGGYGPQAMGIYVPPGGAQAVDIRTGAPVGPSGLARTAVPPYVGAVPTTTDQY